MKNKKTKDFLACLAHLIEDLSSHEFIMNKDVPKFLATHFSELNGTPLEILYNEGERGLVLVQDMIEKHAVGWLYQIEEVA